jgi:hypothetical protein
MTETITCSALKPLAMPIYRCQPCLCSAEDGRFRLTDGQGLVTPVAGPSLCLHRVQLAV